MKYYYECNRLSRYLDVDPNKPDQDEKRIISILEAIEDCLNLATIQIERLIEDELEAQHASEHLRPQSFERSKPFLKYFSDAEFFVNVTNKYFALIKKLKETSIKESIDAILEPHEDMINIYRLTRNSFEHIDERLIKQDSFIKEISSVSENVLETKHGSIKLTAETLTPLYAIFEQIITIVNLMVESRKKDIDLFWREFDRRTKKLWDKQYGPLN